MKTSTRFLLAFVGSFFVSICSHAESQFTGFYGQISTGFENNQISNISPNWVNTTDGGFSGSGTASSQNISSMPLVLGAGYFAELENSFMFGVGVDYSPLAQSTGNFSQTSTNEAGYTFPITNTSYQVSNRVNVYIMPGYAIDANKLGYLKLGYSTQTLKYQQNPDPVSGLATGFSNTASLDGFLVGFGYKQMIAEGLYGFAEANYITYAKTTLNGSSQTTLFNQNINFSSSPSASSYNFLFGLGYRF